VGTRLFSTLTGRPNPVGGQQITRDYTNLQTLLLRVVLDILNLCAASIIPHPTFTDSYVPPCPLHTCQMPL